MNWKVPLTDTNLGEEEILAASKVIKSGWLTQGAEVENFEKEFASMLGVKYAIAVANGTAALHLAYIAAGLKKGDHFCLPALTFMATMNAGLYIGAKPVLIDCASEDDLTISPEDLRKKLTNKTKLIVTMPYGGFPPQMEKIMSEAKSRNIPVVEDACHAPSAEYINKKGGRAKKIGTFGLLSTYSFFGNKNITTGEGGMIVTNSKELCEILRRLRAHGITSSTFERFKGNAFTYDAAELGYNYRFDEIRAAVGRAQLKKLTDFNKARQINAQTLREKIEELKIEGLKIPFKNPNGKSAHHLFVIILPPKTDRYAFIKYLREKGVQTSIHYPDITGFAYSRNIFKAHPKLPVFASVINRLVTLPLYPNLKPEQIDYLAREIASFFTK